MIGLTPIEALTAVAVFGGCAFAQLWLMRRANAALLWEEMDHGAWGFALGLLLSALVGVFSVRDYVLSGVRDAERASSAARWCGAVCVVTIAALVFYAGAVVGSHYGRVGGTWSSLPEVYSVWVFACLGLLLAACLAGNRWMLGRYRQAMGLTKPSEDSSYWEDA